MIDIHYNNRTEILTVQLRSVLPTFYSIQQKYQVSSFIRHTLYNLYYHDPKMSSFILDASHLYPNTMSNDDIIHALNELYSQLEIT